MDNDNTFFEDLFTGEAFEYDGKVYFKATAENGGEDCAFCIEDSEVRYTFPNAVARLHFSNYDITDTVDNEYHKSKSNGRRNH